MSQGFLFKIENDCTGSIYISPDAVDDCLDPAPGWSTSPFTLEAGATSDQVYAQVRTMCDDGKFVINFTPDANEINNRTGTVELSFDKASTEVYPYGIVMIISFTPGVNAGGTSIYPSISMENDTGDEWTVGILHLSTVLDPSEASKQQ